MSAIANEQLIGQLTWRYATKQFDPARKIGAKDWATLEDALVLTPSSCGLQPWKFIIVTDPAIRQKLMAVSWGQKQIVDASHLVVFAIKAQIAEADVEEHIKRTAEVRGTTVESLKGFRDMILGTIVKGLPEDGRRVWARNQVYIALGNFLTSAAMLGLDACPMEGIEPAKYDEILGLDKKGLSTVVVATAGYRAATDNYSNLKKVRFPKEQVLVRV